MKCTVANKGSAGSKLPIGTNLSVDRKRAADSKYLLITFSDELFFSIAITNDLVLSWRDQILKMAKSRLGHIG
jgi:hypothetical protein